MRRAWLLVFAFCLAASSALSDSSNLKGGVFIAHAPPGLQYTTEEPDWCNAYSKAYAIDSCSEQNDRIDLDGNQGQSSVWFVLAAWDEAKEWCGVEFGLGEYDPDIYPLIASGPCFPEGGGLAIPSTGWPGPSAGVALSTSGTPWSGNFVAIYYFAGYAYGKGTIPLSVNPVSDFGGTANCATPPEEWAAESFGAMGILEDGVSACPEGMDGGGLDGGTQPDGADGSGGYQPDDNEDVAVCCTGVTCALTTAEECATLDGDFLPDQGSCSPNPCNLVCPDGGGHWATVQAAINAAPQEGGWTIDLCDGTFVGDGNHDIDFLGKPITVRSRSANAFACVVDCQGGGQESGTTRRGFVFHTGEGAGSILENITITNGSATGN
jgi:hypothetical protein